ncbi:LytR C-terminal domain-containing protein, partial [Saccharothrix algeriensis]
GGGGHRGGAGRRCRARASPRCGSTTTAPSAGWAATGGVAVRRAGWEVADVANYSQGLIPTTTVYYRPGTDEEASARQLGEALGVEVKPRFDGIEQAHAGIIVIVTDSYQSRHGKV